jgi:hypothetical protein
MGKDVERTEFTRADRQRFRQKVRQCLDVFAQMLAESRFDTDRPMSGLEVELNLVDEAGDPASSAGSTSRSTCRRASWARAGSPGSRTTCGRA